MKLFLSIFFAGNFAISLAQQVKMIKFDELKSSVNLSDDTLYILNFWATWCKPCVQELPFFENCNQQYQDKKIKIILVNLDFNSQVTTVVEPFIKKKKLSSYIIHITDTDPNAWINKVDSAWSGAIPATVMYLNSKKIFFTEGPIKSEKLIDEINKNLK